MSARVKVCGVTAIDDALAAARLGADMIGVNFYRPSPRYVTPRRAAAIAAALRAEPRPQRRQRPLCIVGIFVDEDPALVERIVAEVGLDLVQLHGDEPPAYVARFGARAIKALRVRDRLDPATALAQASSASDGEAPWGFLIDYADPALRGGSGRSWRFESLRGLDFGRPVLIAGGLGPANVAAAIAAAEPWGVDVCSGVEAAPGRKDGSLLRRFFEEVDHAQSAAAS